MRKIKFRAWMKNAMYYNHSVSLQIDGTVVYLDTDGNWKEDCEKEIILMQYTGLNDKNGTPIYEGDVIRYMEPIRTTQTHTGDNIPNGSYTEPMEPGIKTHEGEIKFHEGSFIFDDFETNDDHFPIYWCFREWDEEGIRDAISYGRDPARWPWDDPEEGDLQYLLEENNLTTAEELCKYLSGVEVIGNIHDEEYSN